MKRALLRSTVVLGVSAASLAGATDAVAAGPRLVKGPYLTALSDSAVEVRFELDTAAPAGVELTAGEGSGDGAAARSAADGPATMHAVRVTGLEAAKAYDYAVRIGGAVVGKGHFVTAPAAGTAAPVKLLAYGDTRSDETAHAALVRAMMATPSDFLVNTGDIVAAGANASDWQSFFQIEQPLLRDRPLFLCIGNHELYDDQVGSAFARYFGFADATDAGGPLRPYGTVRWGTARLFFLNGMHDWKHGEERDWLEHELTRSDTEAGLVWRIAVVHHAPWSSGPHGGNPKLLDAKVPELLAAHKVDLLLAGHDHIYERGEHGGDAPLKYVITGGGGAPLYPIEHRQLSTRKAEAAYQFVEVTLTSDALRLVAHRLDGTTLETCGFTKGSSWDCDPSPKQEAPGVSGGPSPEQASPSSSSKCGCSLPGAPTGLGAGAWFALAVAGASAVRRRRG
jgi:MYXO-CTERM domain-containing protein